MSGCDYHCTYIGINTELALYHPGEARPNPPKQARAWPTACAMILPGGCSVVCFRRSCSAPGWILQPLAAVVLAPEHRLSLAVVPVPFSGARVRLFRRRRYGPNTRREFSLDSCLPSEVQIAPVAAQSVVAGNEMVTSAPGFWTDGDLPEHVGGRAHALCFLNLSTRHSLPLPGAVGVHPRKWVSLAYEDSSKSQKTRN